VNIDYFNKDFYNQNTAYIIASYQPVKDASDLLRQAIKSILKFRDKNVSLWVVDIGSPDADYLVKPEEFPEVNFIYRSFEIRSYGFSIGIKARLFEILKLRFIPRRNGSYANGYALDYIIKIFKKKNYNPKFFVTSQQDIVILTNNFFTDMKKKFSSKTFAVGVLKQMNKSNEFEILHSVCCMWKYKYVLSSKFGFLPKLPRFDCGEKMVLEFKNKGLEMDYFRNSYNDISVFQKIEKKFLEIGEGVDRAINDKSEVIFMHLGRGVVKSQGTYKKQNRTSVQQWIEWCNKNV
jgi:hypothetical protein